MKDKTLFYVESPFQLIQVYEVIQEKKITNFTLWVRLNEVSANNEQIKKLAKALSLPVSKYLNCFSVISCVFLSFLLLANSFFFKSLYIGDENSKVFRLIKRFIPIQKVTLLDDGVATINQNPKNKRYARFSIFDNKDTTHFNAFTCLKRFIFSNLEDPKPVNVIVGSKFVEAGICSQEVYLEAIKMMINHKPLFDPIIYIPHRGEAVDNLERIRLETGVDVVITDLPIELIAYELNVKPVNIYSLLSTAVFSMKLIYSESSFELFKLPNRVILSRKEALINIYSFIDAHQVATINNVDLIS